MSADADEDTELRDLVAQTLEANGTLGKLRAQLRAGVFLALEDQEKTLNKTPFLNKELASFLATKEGVLVASLVQEFLEFFSLDYTLSVFQPETGLNKPAPRTELLKELKIPPRADAPVLSSFVSNSKTTNSQELSGSGDSMQIAKDLSDKQISEARAKFELYDKDNSGAIDKNELRSLFLDMFPAFNRNMLERYVNDEFNAADKNFSSSIDFTEFLGMYKRLFLLCRTVVASDVEDIISLRDKPEVKKIPDQEQRRQPEQDMKSFGTATKSITQAAKVVSEGGVGSKLTSAASATKPITHPDKLASESNGGSKHSTHSEFDSEPEEDPFFDDIPIQDTGFSTLSSFVTQRARPSFLSQLEKSKRPAPEAVKQNGLDSQAKPPSNSLSSLSDLPPVLNVGRGGLGSLLGAPPLTQPKPSPSALNSKLNDSDIDKNLRAIDKRMIDLGLDETQNDDIEYEEDFSHDHSVSQKTNSKAEGKQGNGSIAEEIDEEEIEDISIEGEDFSRSDKSGFDGLTTDCSVSQVDGGFDYAEDAVKS